MTDKLSLAEKANATLVSENHALKQQLITLQSQSPSYLDPHQQKRHRLSGHVQPSMSRQQSQKKQASDARHLASGLSNLALAPTTSGTTRSSTKLGNLSPGFWTDSSTSPTSPARLAPTDPLGSFRLPTSQADTRLGLSSFTTDGNSRDTDTPATGPSSSLRSHNPSALTLPSPSSAASRGRELSSSVAGLDEAGFREGFSALFRSVENWSKKFANIPNRQADQTLPTTTRALLNDAGDQSLREVILSRVETRWCFVERAIIGYLMRLIHGYALLEQFDKEVGGKVDVCVGQLQTGTW